MSKIKNAVARFHSDEAGNEAIQTVAILAVGAMVLIALMSVWNTNVKTPTTNKLNEIFTSGGAAGGAAGGGAGGS